MKPKRVFLLLLAVVLIAAFCPAYAENNAVDCPRVETKVAKIKKYGHLQLDITATSMMAMGYEPGDVLTVTVGGNVYEMPLCRDYSDVEQSCMLCRLDYDPDAGDDAVLLSVNLGDFATDMRIAERISISEDPGYRWEYLEGVEVPLPVVIEIKEKGGYLAQYELHRLERSNNRADYPNLTDAEYANFRAVTTTGMGKGALYRSSSPVDPNLNRNTEADAALFAAGVQTILNITDDENTLHAYEGYANTYYSKCNIIALSFVMDISSASFKKCFAEELRFLIKNEGPYLIHCAEGKDRTGFTIAVLETLMGASLDETVADYMKTYSNFYGIEPGSEKYKLILDENFISALARIFHLKAADLEKTDLSACAANYLAECGLSDDEITAVKNALSVNYAN